MSDLKNAILDAKYIDMVALADFVVQDCGLPDMDDDGAPLPQQNEIAAAIFRWAAMQDKPEADTQAADTDTPDDSDTPRDDATQGENG